MDTPVALVTGASSGIGAAITRRLLSDGFRVAACARRDSIEALSDSENYLPLLADLRKPEEMAEVFSQVRKKWGGTGILINNAGLGHNAPLMSGETEKWREMLEVNILALLICSREAIADMRKAGDTGHIVHISSLSAHRVAAGGGVYSATKYAVRSLTEGLRQELRAAGSDIRLSSISPGFVETEFAEKFHQDKSKADETYGRYPVLQSPDIADMVSYILALPPHAEIHDMLVRPTRQVT